VELECLQYTDSLTVNIGGTFQNGRPNSSLPADRLVRSNNVYGFFDFNGQYTQQIGLNTRDRVADFLLG